MKPNQVAEYLLPAEFVGHTLDDWCGGPVVVDSNNSEPVNCERPLQNQLSYELRFKTTMTVNSQDFADFSYREEMRRRAVTNITNAIYGDIEAKLRHLRGNVYYMQRDEMENALDRILADFK